MSDLHPASRGRERGTATLYRMVMPTHICPYGLKAKNLLERNGYRIEDHWLRTRDEVAAFKARHDVPTTPRIFIDGEPIGGYDDLRRHLGKSVRDPGRSSYRPVSAIFTMTALMAAALSQAVYGSPLTSAALEWFVAFSMCVLALLKLQDLDRFSTMFLNYDLLAQRWVRYAYIYPFAEGLPGLLMISGRLPWLSGSIALGIGAIGTASVVKAVYIDRRELRCACVGGSAQVPLGVISLSENVLMLAMGAWLLARPLLF